MMKKKNMFSLHWSIPEKTKQVKGEGLGMWNFPGVCGVSKGYQEKIMWNFQGSWLLVLEFPRGCNAGLHNFQGWSFDLSGISRVKVNK